MDFVIAKNNPFHSLPHVCFAQIYLHRGQKKNKKSADPPLLMSH